MLTEEGTKEDPSPPLELLLKSLAGNSSVRFPWSVDPTRP